MDRLVTDKSGYKKSESYTFESIGYVESCYKQKFATPRQPGLVSLGQAMIRLHEPCNSAEAVSGLDQCSHIWLQFVFHKTMEEGWSDRVRPPRLGGNKRLGVFATRSTHRPNPIGLSVVKLESVEVQSGVCLKVSGIDLVQGTPILDIKPYLPYADTIFDAENTIAPQAPEIMNVTFSEEAERGIQDAQSDKEIELRRFIDQVLQQDPRPAYQAVDEERLYGVQLFDLELKWRYQNNCGTTFIWVESVLPV